MIVHEFEPRLTCVLQPQPQFPSISRIELKSSFSLYWHHTSKSLFTDLFPHFSGKLESKVRNRFSTQYTKVTPSGMRNEILALMACLSNGKDIFISRFSFAVPLSKRYLTIFFTNLKPKKNCNLTLRGYLLWIKKFLISEKVGLPKYSNLYFTSLSK